MDLEERQRTSGEPQRSIRDALLKTDDGVKEGKKDWSWVARKEEGRNPAAVTVVLGEARRFTE